MILIQSYEAPRDLLTGQVYKRGGTGVAERLYTYNALGIPTTRRSARQGMVRHDAFGYNERSELTSAALGSAPDTYAYDNDADGCKASWTNTKCSPAGRAAEAQPMGRRRVNIGNRKTAQEEAESITYAANELNQYTDITTGEENFIPEYDLDGKSPDGCKGDWTNREARLPRRGEPPMGRRRINQTRIRTSTGIWTASYNTQNRPVRFTRENTDGTRTVITAAYDYMGRQAWKKVETIATDPETGEETATIALHQRYIYRGYLQVTACDLMRGGHPCLWLITWDPTQPTATRPLGVQKDGTWYVYGWGLTKNVCEVFGQAGYIRTIYSYTPYGSVTEEGDVAQPLQWSSEYADPELGLVYYNYRYYNPVDGRWMRRDPMGLFGGLNAYGFAVNAPLLFIDLWGAAPRGLEITADKSQCAIHVVLKLAFIDKRKNASTEADVAQIKKEIEEVWNSNPQAARKGCCTVDISVVYAIIRKKSDLPAGYFLVYLHSNASILQTNPVIGGRRYENVRSKVIGTSSYPAYSSQEVKNGYKKVQLTPSGIAYIHPDNVFSPSLGHFNVELYQSENQNRRRYTYAHEAGHIMTLPDEYVKGYKIKIYDKDLMASSELDDHHMPHLRTDYFEKITKGVECPCGKKERN